MRCAIYFIPPADDPLTVAAARWLLRDPYSGDKIEWPVDGLTDADHAFVTALPRRYGFHATLKAPFRLADGHSVHELEKRLSEFCDRTGPVRLSTTIGLIDNVFAFLPVAHVPELDLLAARVVTEFDHFRSPITEVDLARRDVSRLTGRQLANLMTWGYPHVFDQFRFHMTLTGPIDQSEREHMATVLERHFAALANAAVEIGQLVLAVEPEPLAPFIVHSAHEFTLETELRIA